MQRTEAVIATTHVDLQGDRLSVEALRDLAARAFSAYIPLWVEHDPRIPPRGRISAARVEEREDGEYEVIATIETFEDSDSADMAADMKEMVIQEAEVSGLRISSGWQHRSPEDRADVDAIATVFGTQARLHAQKALDPISVITITGAFVVGGIASGFLKEIGSDGYKIVKAKLASIFSRERKTSGDRLLSFQVMLERNGVQVEIDIIQTNPSAEEIDELISSGLAKIDNVLPYYLDNQEDIRRLVFEAKGKEVEVKFAVRKDCRPLGPIVPVRDASKRDGA